MNCKEVEEQEILEAYLLDRLTEPQRDEFEQHFFECASCFSQLQNSRMLQEELRCQPVVQARAGSAHLRRIWAWTPAFAVVVVVLALGIWWYSARRQHPVLQAVSSPHVTTPESAKPSHSAAMPSLDQLARVEPPPYSPALLRGAEDSPEQSFRKGMQHYSNKDYAAAIPGLRAAGIASPGTARYQFYLGACYLLTNQTDLAIESFRKIVSLGDRTYSDLAHFYLAKAYLRKKDVSAAEQELQATVQLGGSKAAQAGELLHQLGK